MNEREQAGGPASFLEESDPAGTPGSPDGPLPRELDPSTVTGKIGEVF